MTLKNCLVHDVDTEYDSVKNQLDIYDNWLEYTEEILVKQNWIGHAKTAAYVISNFHTDVSIADIGCGTGSTGAILTMSGYRNVDGYDIVDSYIDASKKFYRKTEYCNILESTLPKRYDVIIASGLFNFGCLSSEPAKHIAKSLNRNGTFVMINPTDDIYLEKSGWNDQEYFDIVETSPEYYGRYANNQWLKYKTNILKKTLTR